MKGSAMLSMGASVALAEPVLLRDRPDDDTCWAAVLARDRLFNGKFVTGVLSTHIYCRPSCPARHPVRAHVRFFANGEQARAAGFRACLGCVPDAVARDEQAVVDAIAQIQIAGAPVALAVLAGKAGYSPAHFQRVFSRATGLSPATYGRALRMERARDALTGGDRVTDAIYDAGFAVPSRFYDAARDRLGMAPSAWVDGGRDVVIRWAVVATNLGQMLVAATDKGVCRLAFGESLKQLAARFPHAELVEGGDEFAALVARVVAEVESPGASSPISLDVRGTAFQEAVWRQLRQIPAGETRSYGQIAAAIGKPGAVREVGAPMAPIRWRCWYHAIGSFAATGRLAAMLMGWKSKPGC